MRIKNLSDSEYVITDFILQEIDKRRFCVFDCEATGPDEMNDQIIQIGAVILGENGSVIEQYMTLVRPAKPIPEFIESLTGISNSDVEKAHAFSSIIDEFYAFIKGCVLVTQAGYEYDLPLLREECKRNNKTLDLPIALDTKALFTYLHPEITDIVSTNFLIRYYKIDDTDFQRHDALGDSILISKIFNKMIGECMNKGIHEIIFDNLKVKRVKLTILN